MRMPHDSSLAHCFATPQVVRSLITITAADSEKLRLFKEVSGVLAGLQQVRGSWAGLCEVPGKQ
jgi:hypothetical protein